MDKEIIVGSGQLPYSVKEWESVKVVLNGEEIQGINPVRYNNSDKFSDMEFYMRRRNVNYFRNVHGLRMVFESIERLPLKYGDSFQIKITTTVE